jgi:outer membrane protein insertion porin family
MSAAGAAVLVVALVALTQPAMAGGGEGLPPVVAVELESPHRLPEPLVRQALGDLTGQPRRRDLIRDTIERLAALDLFSAIQVEERPAPGGVVLRYRLVRRPHVASIEFEGDLGLSRVDLTAATALAPGDPADPGRLESARQAILARYRREGFLEAEAAVASRLDPATNGHAVVFRLRAGAHARIGAVEVRGVDDPTAARVRRAARLRPGDPYREDAVREGVEAAEAALRAQHLPAARVEAAPRERPAAARVDLTLVVVPGPRLHVELDGRRAVAEKVLRARLTFGLVGLVDEAEVATSGRQIEAEYRERGHAFAEVRGTLAREDDAIRVRYDITEGPRVTVERVDFVGDLPLPATRLEAVLDLRGPRLLRSAIFRRDALERDEQVLRSLLRAEGHADARAGPIEVAFSEDRTRVRVTIPIDAGPRVRVGAVEVDGARVVRPAELLRALPLEPGGPWSEARVEDGRRAIQRQYAARGYHAIEVVVDEARRDHAVDVTYRVHEGGPTRIGRVVVRGLVQTREEVVRRELRLAVGDPLNPAELIEAQRRLTALGLFDRVDVEPLRPPPVPFADVVVTVQEGRPWHVAAGAGYSTYEGGRGFVEAGHDNILGTGRSLALRFRLSERGDRTDLTYREPYLFGLDVRGDAALFRERREEIGFSFERTGLTLGAQRALADWLPGLRGSVRYQFALVDRFAVDRTLAAADVVPGREIVASLTPELTLERRDRPLDPTRGSFHLVSLTGAGRALGSEAEFLKGRLHTHGFFDWLPPTVLALSGRLGLATPLGDSARLPIEERFFAGGATTVRGYRERRLGPLDASGNPTGGNALLVLNAEWRFPLWRWIGGHVFYDVGTVAPEVSDLGQADLGSGVGAGLRATTPFGPIRLDAGYPLGPLSDAERTFRVYVTIGHPF